MATELSRVMESVGKDKGIERDEIVRAVEEAVLSAAQRLFRTEGKEKELEVHFNDEEGEVGIDPQLDEEDPAQVGAGHDHPAVRQVHHPEHAVDQPQAVGHGGVEAGQEDGGDGQVEEARHGPHPAGSSFFSTLPMAFRGSSATSLTARGRLWGASRRDT